MIVLFSYVSVATVCLLSTLFLSFTFDFEVSDLSSVRQYIRSSLVVLLRLLLDMDVYYSFVLQLQSAEWWTLNSLQYYIAI